MPADFETAHALLATARDTLREAGVEDPLLVARLLLSYALGIGREELLRRGDAPIGRDEAGKFRDLVALKARRVPLAYLTGRREFYGWAFEVTPAVLIPRPETELLVDLAIARLRPGGVLLDVGTGCGCIAVSAAAAGWERTLALDVSALALDVARRNAARRGVQARVGFARADVLAGIVSHCADLVLSNPPYIPTGELARLEPEVRDYEPRAALDGGPDGLVYHRRIGDEARRVLRPGGVLAMEVGAGQAPSVAEMLREQGYCRIWTQRDLAGIERVVAGEWVG